jgi:hypothetical protein
LWRENSKVESVALSSARVLEIGGSLPQLTMFLYAIDRSAYAEMTAQRRHLHQPRRSGGAKRALRIASCINCISMRTTVTSDERESCRRTVMSRHTRRLHDGNRAQPRHSFRGECTTRHRRISSSTSLRGADSSEEEPLWIVTTSSRCRLAGVCSVDAWWTRSLLVIIVADRQM